MKILQEPAYTLSLYGLIEGNRRHKDVPGAHPPLWFNLRRIALRMGLDYTNTLGFMVKGTVSPLFKLCATPKRELRTP